MKLRLIQLTGLFVFVVVILMLTPPDKGFGGDPSEHIPDLWINTSGYLSTPDNPGPHLIGQPEDPRGKNFHAICGTNGDESLSGLAWYYKGGMMDDPGAHAAEPNSPNHSYFEQNVYNVYLEGSVSTSANEASGVLDPGIGHPESIELPAAHSSRSFKGQGKITLDIPTVNYHVPKYDMSLRYVGCDTRTSKTYYFKPPNEEVLKVVVHVINVTEKRKGAINVEADFIKGAKAIFTHEWDWGGSWPNQRGRGFGMEASVGGWWEAYWNEELKLQGKNAQVYGNVQKAKLPLLNAEFDTINSWCPPDTGYSQTQRKYIPHVRTNWPYVVH